jgi:hypothetical protein
MKRLGVYWLPPTRASGSRSQGWQQIREYLKAAQPDPRRHPREPRHLRLQRNCDQFLRTVPVLPRDEKDLDDVDTRAEDHIGDEVRYYLRRKRLEMGQRKWK